MSHTDKLTTEECDSRVHDLIARGETIVEITDKDDESYLTGWTDYLMARYNFRNTYHGLAFDLQSPITRQGEKTTSEQTSDRLKAYLPEPGSKIYTEENQRKLLAWMEYIILGPHISKEHFTVTAPEDGFGAVIRIKTYGINFIKVGAICQALATFGLNPEKSTLFASGDPLYELEMNLYIPQDEIKDIE